MKSIFLPKIMPFCEIVARKGTAKLDRLWMIAHNMVQRSLILMPGNNAKNKCYNSTAFDSMNLRSLDVFLHDGH